MIDQEKRLSIYIRDGGICQSCGGMCTPQPSRYDKHGFEIAHRIKSGKGSENHIIKFILTEYGHTITRKTASEILDHRDNLKCTHGGCCNDAQNIFYQPIIRDELIRQIYEKLEGFNENKKTVVEDSKPIDQLQRSGRDNE